MSRGIDIRIGWFQDDVEQPLRFYAYIRGLAVTEEKNWNGHRCVFLLATTVQHSPAL